MSHTQRRDNSLRGSLQGLALSVVCVRARASDDHDELNERPDGGDRRTNHGDRQNQLNDALGGVTQVEVVDTQGTQEERQEQRDDPLLGGGAEDRLRVSLLTVGLLTVGLLACSVGGLLVAGLTVGIRTVSALRVRVGAGDAVALLRLGVGAGRGGVIRICAFNGNFGIGYFLSVCAGACDANRYHGRYG